MRKIKIFDIFVDLIIGILICVVLKYSIYFIWTRSVVYEFNNFENLQSKTFGIVIKCKNCDMYKLNELWNNHKESIIFIDNGSYEKPYLLMENFNYEWYIELDQNSYFIENKIKSLFKIIQYTKDRNIIIISSHKINLKFDTLPILINRNCMNEMSQFRFSNYILRLYRWSFARIFYPNIDFIIFDEIYENIHTFENIDLAIEFKNKFISKSLQGFSEFFFYHQFNTEDKQEIKKNYPIFDKLISKKLDYSLLNNSTYIDIFHNNLPIDLYNIRENIYLTNISNHNGTSVPVYIGCYYKESNIYFNDILSTIIYYVILVKDESLSYIFNFIHSLPIYSDLTFLHFVILYDMNNQHFIKNLTNVTINNQKVFTKIQFVHSNNYSAVNMKDIIRPSDNGLLVTMSLQNKPTFMQLERCIISSQRDKPIFIVNSLYLPDNSNTNFDIHKIDFHVIKVSCIHSDYIKQNLNLFSTDYIAFID